MRQVSAAPRGVAPAVLAEVFTMWLVFALLSAVFAALTSILKMWKSEEVKKKFVRRYRTVSPSGLTSVSVSVRSTTLKHSSV